MNIIFHNDFYCSDYANDGAAAEGRMEAIINVLSKVQSFRFIQPQSCSVDELKLAHSEEHINSIKSKSKLFSIASLACGASINAAMSAYSGTPSFACVRPPGHHAYRNQSWGYCYFSNIAIALLQLKKLNMINSAFLLDFDAHTGDGTIDVLRDWKECLILNPMAEANNYIKCIENFISEKVHSVDIIAVSAGFDSYEKDVGKKLRTFDFFVIGRMMKLLATKLCKGRRFAVLEGGYYQEDLGKNVLSFCQGFE